ncbi:MAG: MBL fold metallo-hydrolase, partial [Candidatus Doudnabacteria bacterium]|nr:MBL fold metallo-hydrolase [Candidatus Doudnabacteria bacterium]
DNKFGHPAAQTLEKLQSRGIKIWRTDMDRDVVIESDGARIKEY